MIDSLSRADSLTRFSLEHAGTSCHYMGILNPKTHITVQASSLAAHCHQATEGVNGIPRIFHGPLTGQHLDRSEASAGTTQERRHSFGAEHPQAQPECHALTGLRRCTLQGLGSQR